MLLLYILKIVNRCDIEAIICIDVIPATVPEPWAILKITPIPYANSINAIVFSVFIPNVETRAFPISVSLKIDPNDPPAPVIKRTIPAVFKTVEAALSLFFSS